MYICVRERECRIIERKREKVKVEGEGKGILCWHQKDAVHKLLLLASKKVTYISNLQEAGFFYTCQTI